MTYCDRCDSYFNSWHSYDQHVADSPRHWVCEECDRDFETWERRRQHYIQSPRHAYCRRCDMMFPTQTDLFGHYKSAHYWCESCDRFFQNDFGLQEHYRQSHYYCVPCRRLLKSDNNLRQHERSGIHRPKDVYCPFLGCTQSFVSKSALILHLESGSCKSGVDRRAIDRYVRALDRDRLITDPSRLLTHGDTIEWFATERSWNDNVGAYECVICHRHFVSLPDLNRHLASPRHKDKIYRCPLSSCHTTFSTLSALCQHVESEKCGVLRFRAVKEALDGLFDRFGRLTL